MHICRNTTPQVLLYVRRLTPPKPTCIVLVVSFSPLQGNAPTTVTVETEKSGRINGVVRLENEEKNGRNDEVTGFIVKPGWS